MQIWSKARNCAEISNADTKNRWGWGLGREETPYLVMSLLSEFLTQANSRGGGEGTPYNGLYCDAPPERA